MAAERQLGQWWESPIGPLRTGCALHSGQLSHMHLKSTSDTTSGEGSAPGLRYPIVAVDSHPPQCSTDEGVRSACRHQSPAHACSVTILACHDDFAKV